MLKHLAPIAATAIVLLFLLASSVPLMHWFTAEGRLAEFETGLSLWQQQGIEDYDFTVQKDCHCEPPAGIPITIMIRDGRRIDAYDARNADGPMIADLGDLPDTIPALFDVVMQSIDADPDSLSISYDDAYGFPAFVGIDRRKDIRDDEVLLTVTDFRPVADGR